MAAWDAATMVNRPHFQRYAADVRLLPPIAAAVVYPCDRESLQLALSGGFAGYLAPVLIGPRARIRDAADTAGLDISRLLVIDTPDDPRAACLRAAELAEAGDVKALVKGALGIDELLAPIAAPENGLRRERRLSHVHVLDLPARGEPLLLTDALLNFNPNLAAKKDILLNALEFATALGITRPRVALVAAMDVVSPVFSSTADAAALRSMAAQGLFGDSLVDGPLTADSALSPDAARANGARPEVAGQSDIVLAPNMEAATLMLRTLTAATGGLAAGLVLGARVPIVAPARADGMDVRMASCVLASLAAAGGRRAAAGAGKQTLPPTAEASARLPA
ncbi:MAG: bifunctional enoyl-CoA hydratase/phosphate acetyltransferase [Betaproteobacteria bacterium]|nr:bifunctional enoyl-CoA hydratase/phosphate acetyltransferase [Betaproteobacteria bacterium]